VKRLVSVLAIASLVALLCVRAMAQCQTILPGIVYQHAWTGQTASVSQTTVFTPSVNGQYRVNLSGVAIGTGNAGSGHYEIDVYFTWQSASSGNQYECFQDDATGDHPNGSSICTFEGQSGVPVQIKIDVNPSGGTLDHYDEYVTVEQLQ